MSRKGRSSLAAERVNVLPGGRLEEIYEALRRFSSARINKLRLSKYENRVLAAPIAHGLAPRAVKYICWRRSMLSFAFVPFATSTCLKLSQLWNTTNWETFSRNLNAYLPFIGESHTNYFQVRRQIEISTEESTFHRRSFICGSCRMFCMPSRCSRLSLCSCMDP